MFEESVGSPTTRPPDLLALRGALAVGGALAAIQIVLIARAIREPT